MFGFLGSAGVGSRIAHALRTVASALATVGGTLLLLADSTDECAAYEPLTTSFDYSTDCRMGSAGSGTGGTGASSGVGAAGSIAGSGGVGAAGNVAGSGGAGTSGASGAAGSAALQMGHVSLKIPSNPDEANGAAHSALQSAGLDVVSANVSYTSDEPCMGGEEGIATVRGVNVTLAGGGLTELRCTRLALPVRREQTVTCTEIIDAANPATCSLTFSPTPR